AARRGRTRLGHDAGRAGRAHDRAPASVVARRCERHAPEPLARRWGYRGGHRVRLHRRWTQDGADDEGAGVARPLYVPNALSLGALSAPGTETNFAAFGDRERHGVRPPRETTPYHQESRRW